MNVQVTKNGGKIQAVFNFDNVDEIPLEILQHVDKAEMVNRLKQMKIHAVECILEGLTERYQDETNPKKMMKLRAKIEEGKELLEHIKNNDCTCRGCREGKEINVENQLKDILDMNGIHMN